MNEGIYQLGAAGLRVLGKVAIAAGPLDLLARVWLRQRKLRSILQRNQFDGVIDGGANIGEFAQIVRDALPQADLVCVEPHAPSAAKLRRRGFRVVEAALWHKPSRLRLTQAGPASTSCTVLAETAIAAPSWEVEAVRLDSLAIKGSRVLVKLDLQGAEFSALRGMGELWTRCAGMHVEVSVGPNGTYERMRSLLSSHGFAEVSTTNELESEGEILEADKLWLRH